jgi:hypothetical protein
MTLHNVLPDPQLVRDCHAKVKPRMSQHIQALFETLFKAAGKAGVVHDMHACHFNTHHLATGPQMSSSSR